MIPFLPPHEHDTPEPGTSAALSGADVLDAFVEAVIVVDGAGDIRYANRAASYLFGVERETLLASNLDDPRWSRLDSTGRPIEPGESTVLRTIADGIERSDVEVGLRSECGLQHLLLSTRLLRSADHPDGPAAVCLMRDVTEERLASARARVDEHRFRTIAADAPFAIFELDRQGRVVFLTQRWQELTGIRAEELVGQVPLRVFPPEDRARARAVMLAAGEERRHLHLRHRVLHADGTVVPVLSSIAPLLDDDRVVGYLGSMSDLSDHERVERALLDREATIAALRVERERDRLRTQLEQARRLAEIGELSAGIAHDFNNVLGVIQNYATLLERTAALPPRAHEDVARIRIAAENGRGLIDRLLSLGRNRGDVVVVRLAAVVSELVSLLDGAVGKAITLRTELDDIAVRIDPAEARRILLNLVLNARDAMADGGTITISLRPTDELGPDGHRLAALTVSDDGHGMSADVQRRAFEPFFTTKAPGSSSGMGLPTVRRIAEDAGGRLTISSTPGRGTEVCVLLPCGTRHDNAASTSVTNAAN